MRLEDLNWMDVEEYLKHDDRLMLVIGACEQHGYLSLLTDIKIPLAFADAASRQTGVLVAPPLNFGVSPYFLAYPGSLSLRVSTFIAAVEDIVRSAYGQGFRRILILNGHGGNTAAHSRLNEVINELPDLKLGWYAWWTSHSVEAVALKHEIKPAHANWLEAFAFTIVGEMPEAEKSPPYVPSAIMDAQTTRQVYGDGSFGGPYRADEAVMHEIFDVVLKDILQILKFE
ncbi:MAG: creatininase family protein [Chloroflexi bacterium]|nr:creatininase family protein [Chloroflexota bacterium]